MEFSKEEKDQTTKELIKATQEALTKGNRILKEKGKPRIPKIEVVVDKLKGTTAGKAYLEDKAISYNLEMAILNGRDFLKEVPTHEVAHIIAYELNGCIHHDNTWKNVMTRMGLSPLNTHKFSDTVSPYIHLCPNCLHENDITQKMYDEIKDGVKKYGCLNCEREMKLRDIIKKEF